MDNTDRRPSVSSAICYKDPKAALKWLEEAFGFEPYDAHCERARQAGAVIQMEPTTQFYGDRTYRAVDPEGHVWSFGQTITRMTSDEWDKAMGITTRARL